MRRISRYPWLRLVQAICTLGLAFVLWRSIDWGLFKASLAELRWSFVALAALFLLIAHGFNIVRWKGLLPPNNISLGTLTSYYGAGLFSNNFLPTGVGGDAVRAALVGAQVGWSHALLSVALDRGIGLVGLSFFIVPGLWFGLPDDLLGRFTIPPALQAWLLPLAVVGAGAAVAIGGVLVYRRGRQMQGMLSRLQQGDDQAGAARRSGRAWAVMLVNTYALSVCSNLGTIAAHWAVLQALGITVSPGASIWLVMIGSLSQMVPISINSLGVLESVFVVVLAAYGVAAPAALAAALLIRALLVLYSLLGGLLSLRQNRVVPGELRTPPPLR
ncbi:MAG: flippase-like domain-containing protein [Chloroflexales bacterium]|nr:flippase-like domain-containing protein [Chloroflexales bacterium]